MNNKTISLQELIEELRKQKPELEPRYKVKTLGLFGSYLRGEQNKMSD
jgi:predicted nucleotidyltransferase